MSFKDQVINLIIQGRDLFSSEAKKSEKTLAELAEQSEKLNQRLEELQDQKQAVDTIEDLTAAVSKGTRSYSEAAAALSKLQQEQRDAAGSAKKLQQEQAQAATQTAKLEQDYQQLSDELQQYNSQIDATRARLEQLTAEQQSGAVASGKHATAIAAAKADLQALEQAQSSTRTAADQLNTELEQQRQVLDRLNTESDEAALASADYAAKVKLARGELNTLGSSLNKNQRTLNQQKAVLDKAGISMDKLAEASEDLKQQQAAAENALDGVNKNLARQNRLLDESSKGAEDFGGSIKQATASLLAMASAYIGVDRLWASLTGILSAGDKAKAFTAQMTAMMGSLSAGEQATAWIKEFANNTGSKLDTIKQAFASLKAFGIDPMNGSLQAMVDYNAKLGGSQEKLEGIILAVGQAWAKQKLQGEEILQLVERGVPVWELLEKVTGKNTVQLSKLSEQGKLGRETIQALFEEMGKGANGQAAKSLERLSGQVNVLSNNWELFQQKIADSGLYEVGLQFLDDLNNKFDELNGNGKLQQAAADISNFFSTIIKDGGESLTATIDNIRAFTQGLTVVGASIQLVWNGITAGLSTLAMTATAAYATILSGWAKLLDAVGVDALAAKIREATGAIYAISKGFKDQVEQDGADIQQAWATITKAMAKSSKDSYKASATAAKESAAEQKAAANETSSALDKQAAKAKAYELAMAKAGITTVRALREQADIAKSTFAQVSAALKDGTASAYDQKQAFLEWAEAEVKVAAAGKQQVSVMVQQAAAALGLNAELQRLIATQQNLSNSQQNVEQGADNTADSVEQSGERMNQAMQDVGDTTENVGKQVSGVAAVISQAGYAAYAAVKELSEGTVALFKSLTSGVAAYNRELSDIEQTQEKIENLRHAINELYLEQSKTLDFTRLRRWQYEQDIASKSAQMAYYEQRVELLKLVEALDDTDSANMQLLRSAEHASKTLGLLNEQDLDLLTAAIDKARSRMDALKDSASDTLSSLLDELDEYEGRQADIEKRRYQQELADIKSQLAAAEKTGDRELLDQLRRAEQTLNKVYKYRTEEVKAQQQQNQRDTQSNSTSTQQQNQPKQTTSQASFGNSYNATLTLIVEGRRTQLDTNKDQLDELLRSIEKAKLTHGN
ncbi:tape measure protein [Shewanella algae]|uniref:tape measure protein n=1 Tax=Shewanella algae TaxID=38313 RepID=UPI000D1509B9|nr:tape measure protein [Shewanella algae]PST68878.1 hypothetical protein AYI77_01915 [Shewanella algae]